MGINISKNYEIETEYVNEEKVPEMKKNHPLHVKSTLSYKKENTGKLKKILS